MESERARGRASDSERGRGGALEVSATYGVGAPDGGVVRRHGGLEGVAHTVFDQFGPGQIRPARTHRADRPQRFTLQEGEIIEYRTSMISDEQACGGCCSTMISVFLTHYTFCRYSSLSAENCSESLTL